MPLEPVPTRLSAKQHFRNFAKFCENNIVYFCEIFAKLEAPRSTVQDLTHSISIYISHSLVRYVYYVNKVSTHLAVVVFTCESINFAKISQKL